MYANRIYADFQNLDDDNRIRLTAAGTRADLAASRLELREGAVLALYTDDAGDDGRPDPLFADGVAEFNAAEQCWVARIDWSRLRHSSDGPGDLPDAQDRNAPGRTVLG